jgi:hypothetical protein
MLYSSDFSRKWLYCPICKESIVGGIDLRCRKYVTRKMEKFTHFEFFTNETRTNFLIIREDINWFFFEIYTFEISVNVYNCQQGTFFDKIWLPIEKIQSSIDALDFVNGIKESMLFL